MIWIRLFSEFNYAAFVFFHYGSREQYEVSLANTTFGSNLKVDAVKVNLLFDGCDRRYDKKNAG